MTEALRGAAEYDRAIVLWEQMGHATDFYVQTAASAYRESIDCRWPTAPLPFIDQYNISRVALYGDEEWDQMHLGLFSIGMHDGNLLLANGALELLDSPANKWRAAVWAFKQGTLWSTEWAWRLGDAKAVAEQNTAETFDIGLAELDLAVYQMRTTPASQAAEQQRRIDEIVADNQRLLADREAFPTNEIRAQQQLRLARVLRDGGDFARAKRLRAAAAPAKEREAFDEYLKQQKDLGPAWRGPRAAGRLPNMIPVDAPNDSFMRVYYPERAAAQDTLGMPAHDSRLVDGLDVLLRAGEWSRARRLFEHAVERDYSSIHLGTLVQAAALMYRHDAGAQFEAATAEVDTALDRLGATGMTVHATAAERGSQVVDRKELLLQTYQAIIDLPNLRDRTERLLRLQELSATMNLTNRQRIDIVGSLQTAWTLWGRAVPADPLGRQLQERATQQRIRISCRVLAACGDAICNNACSPQARMAGLGLIDPIRG